MQFRPLPLALALGAGAAGASLLLLSKATGVVCALVAAVAVATLLRPCYGLMLIAALASLGGAITALASVRGPWIDAMPLAAVAGWLLSRTWVSGDSRTRVLRDDAVVFGLTAVLAAVAATSALVMLGMAHEVTGTSGAWTASSLWRWLTATHALQSHPLTPDAVPTLRFLAGLGVFALAVDVGRNVPSVLAPASRMLVLGITAVAALNVNRFTELALRSGDPLHAALELQRWIRVSTTIPDVNAVASLFLLVLPLAIAAVSDRTRHWWLGVVSVTFLAAGIWLAGSRVVLGLVPVVVIALLLLPALPGASRRVRWVTVACLLLAAVTLVVAYPRARAHGSALGALQVRHELLTTTLRMAESRPAFGVGIGQYFTRSPEFATTALKGEYPAQNAHNQLLQVLGELGVVGLGLFVALLAVAVQPTIEAMKNGTASPLAIRLLIGVGAFLAASMTMHPLLLSDVNTPFWLTLGMLRAAGGIPDMPQQHVRRVGAAVLVGVALLLATVPLRVRAELNDTNLDAAAIGLSRWQRDDTGVRFRTAHGQASVFVDGGAAWVKVPLRVRNAQAPGVDVTVSLDGYSIARITAPVNEWRQFRLILPAHGGSRFRRIDLAWSAGGRAELDVGRELYPED